MASNKVAPVIAGGLALVALFHSAALGQDRARLRPSVLQGLPAAPEQEDLFVRPEQPVQLDDREVFLNALGDILIVPENIAVPAAPELRERLLVFTGEPLTPTSFPAIAETIVSHYEAHDRPVVDVWFPEQDITSGVLQVHVEEGRFGEVSVAGGAHLNRERIAAGIRVRPEQVVSESAIQGELDWLNSNPFHRATVNIAESDDGSTRLAFSLSDERPIRLFAGYENSGVELLGEDRWFAGVALGNLFNLGHQLSYRFFTGDPYAEYHAHALTYHAPLRWRHIVSVNAVLVQSQAEPEVSGMAGESQGVSWLAGIDYRVPFKRWRRIKHSAALGFEFKASNNDFEFGGADTFETPVEVAQFTLDYNAERLWETGATALELGFIWSPGNLSGLNTDEAFTAAREGAESNYIVLKGAAAHRQTLPMGLALNLRARGQWSGHATLVPSEEFAPGGYDAVRGYEERSILGDGGYVLSTELLSPEVSLPGETLLRGLIFCDYGAALNADATSHEPSSTQLASYGAGVRFQMARNLAFRFDYGWQFESRDSRGHIGVAVSF